jgi:hypothetical protein
MLITEMIWFVNSITRGGGTVPCSARCGSSHAYEPDHPVIDEAKFW